MAKFTKESFDVVSVTDIPRVSLSKGVLKLLAGREMFVDVDEDLEETIFSGDVFEAIAGELAEMEGSPILPPQEVIDEIDNLAEIIETELIRIIAI
jgi:hypothetical protein